jgi:hypothetical protein
VLHHSYHTVYMRLLMHKSTRVLCMIAYVSTHIHIYIQYPDIPRGQHYLSWQSIQDNSSVQGKQQQHGTCVCVCVCVVVCGAHERAEFTSFSRSTLTRMPTLFSLHNTTLHYTSLHPHFTVQGPDASLRRDILIATPMRLVHALTNTGLDLSNVRYLVLDEADRLFEMGKGVCCVCERV